MRAATKKVVIKAMRAATRSAAVVGAVSVGALAGPVGAIAAGAAAGAAYDTGTAIVTDGKQVSGVAKIFDKPGEISSWVGAGVDMVGAGVDMVGDGLSGIGAGGLTNVGKEAGKKMANQTVKQVLKQEAKILAVCTATAVTAAAAAAVVSNSASNNGTESTRSGQQNSTAAGSSAADDSSRQKSNGGDSRRGSGKATSGDPDDRRDGSDDKKRECQGATTQQLQKFINIVEAIEEFMMQLGKHTGCLSTINRYLQEFIAAAIPLMNDPTARLNIRGGLLDIVFSNGNRVGISHHQAALLSKVINRSVINSSGVDRPCSRPSCRICSNLSEVQTERGWTGNCETKGAIYGFFCGDCDRFVYAGQTTRALRDRMNHHLNYEGSPLLRHLANTPGHSHAGDLLDIFDIVIMWTNDGVDTELDDGDMKRIIRNWEVFMQWLAEAHKSQGGESKR